MTCNIKLSTQPHTQKITTTTENNSSIGLYMYDVKRNNLRTVGRLVILGSTTLSDRISGYIEPYPRGREKESKR